MRQTREMIDGMGAFKRGGVPRSGRSSQSKPPPRYARARGFTLIEAALTTVIVGTGVLAIVAAQQAYHMKNGWATKTGEAMLLANEVRELTLPMPLHDPITGRSHIGPENGENGVEEYDDVDDFVGASFSPPINALRRPIPDMDRWTQHVKVVKVLPDDIDSTMTYDPDYPTPTMRVRVRITYQGPTDDEPRNITQLTWVVMEKP